MDPITLALWTVGICGLTYVGKQLYNKYNEGKEKIISEVTLERYKNKNNDNSDMFKPEQQSCCSCFGYCCKECLNYESKNEVQFVTSSNKTT
jgi:hypothetical protein